MSSQSDEEAVFIDRDDVSNYNPEQILPEPPEVIQRLRAWLKPTSYDLESSEYRKHLSSHARGTGHWLTNGHSYKDWLQSKDTGLLWIKGIPGSGKSVVASSIIKEISANNQGSPVLYFFFRQIIDANHEPVALLRDWLDQVLEYSPPLQKKLKGYVVKEGYGDKTRALDTMSMQDLWDDLQFAFSGLPGRVYCVADAIDEMDRGNDAFLEALAELGSWNPSKVKVLITSRPVPAVEGPLRHAKCTQIRLQENMVDADISTFVRQGLENTDISHDDQQLIQEAIPGRANGLFLYAKLAMDAFLEPGAIINAVLDSLPADMNQMYTDLLHEHSRRSGVPDTIQRLILQCVTHATRPLRLLEIAEMINVTCNNDAAQNLRSTKDLVRAACGPLLEILPDETVCVIHHSFTEYLKGTTRSPDDDGYPVLLFGETHARLGSACLTYLLSGVFDEVEKAHDTKDIKLKLKYPFVAYALDSWHVHVTRSTAAGHDQIEINLALEKLIRDPGSVETWTKLQWVTVGNANSGITPLHVAAMHGLTAYARHLLSSPMVNVDAVDINGKTPLWWAASSGMSDMVQVLIDAGANPDQEEIHNGLKPLHEAASKNHPEVIKVLLGSGVDPLTPKTRENSGRTCGNARRSQGHTPLMYACQNGHLEALEVFLSFLKDEDSVHQALAWSAGRGRHDLVQRILQHPGVDINRKVRDATPLFMASQWAHMKTMRLLLNEGADPTIRCEYDDEFSGSGDMRRLMRRLRLNDGEDNQSSVFGVTALYFALEGSHEGRAPKGEPGELKALLELFIDKGADIHERSSSGNSLLHLTTNNPVWFRILLEAGVDANVTNGDGHTALHEMKLMSVQCLSMLVETGQTDINKRATSNGKTPLLLSLDGYLRETTLKLIEYGADCSIADNDGNGPLHIALQSSNSRPEVIEALISAGADLHLRNKLGQTPLDVMFTRNSSVSDLMNVMSQAGVDINTRDNKDGATLLFRTISGHNFRSDKDYRDAITSLLERGALLDTRDYEGRTLLHEEIKSQKTPQSSYCEPGPGPSRFDFLVSLGLDVHDVDYQGNTLLHELCWRISPHYNYKAHALLEMLLNVGIDVNRPNYRGRIPLHRLCVNAENGRRDMEDSVLHLVISRTKDINVRDRDGIAPLHLAVTVSEYHTKKLLLAGADPTIETFEGLTPLHLAARSRQGNIVGMLLDALQTRDPEQPTSSLVTQGSWLRRASNSTTPGVNAEANGTTPLYYACLSGQPEIVSMLLDAGADVKGKNFRSAITGFEDELELWRRRTPHDAENGDSGGLTKKDLTRPNLGGYRDRRWLVDPLDDTARLEEIIEMVLKHGGDLPEVPIAAGSDGYRSITDTTSDCQDYALKCLSDAGKRRPLRNSKAASRFGPRAPTFDEILIPHRREAMYKALSEPGVIEPGKANENLFLSRLIRREYDVMEDLFKLGVDFLAPHMYGGHSNLGILVKGGFTSLAKRIRFLAAQEQVDKGVWPAPGDGAQPVFGHNRTWTHDVPDHNATGYRQPFLLQAVHQEWPMLEMVRVLVEDLGVDIDELHGKYKQVDGGYELESPETSALHSLARGLHWWHVAQALPYLISKGANLEIKNSSGQTPLHVAVGAGRPLRLFHKEAARQLVLGGANVNAKDKGGRSCLSYASGDVEMTRLLLQHGATIHADAVFAAISERQPGVLDILLSAGGDANIRFEKNDKNPTRIQGGLHHRWGVGDLIPDAEWYPLHHVAAMSSQHLSKKESDALHAAGLKLIDILLSHGANPFATFVKCSGKECYHKKMDSRRVAISWGRVDKLRHGNDATADPEYSFEPHLHEDCYVLHQLMADGHIVHPFLKLPNIDANLRDGRGRTLLHAASSSRRGPDVPLSLIPWDPWDPKTSTEISMFRHLISLSMECGSTGRVRTERATLYAQVAFGQLPPLSTY